MIAAPGTDEQLDQHIQVCVRVLDMVTSWIPSAAVTEKKNLPTKIIYYELINANCHKEFHVRLSAYALLMS